MIYSNTRNATMNAAARAYQGGDERAFDAIYDELHGAAEYYGRRFPVLGVDPSDLAQDALLALVRAAREWDPARGAPFAAYAKQRMLWAVRNSHRGLSRYADHTVWAPNGDAAPDSDRDLAPMHLAVDAVKGALHDDRDASILRGLIDGKDLDAIGASLGITKQAVSLRKIAIRERLEK